ncbi:Asp23/Gls24 family envelope stress response protein [Glaciihabitans sp. UYNi722]|uniref:Asp23/Gls24 family envelope stress response protein n=1 Tax=Glaciihabitans sp. UYNi722 TaxID=3156344 RepID=UPI0033917508
MANTTVPTTAGTQIPSSNGAGKTVIDDSVIAKVAGIATREVAGVFALGGGAARALGVIRDAINNTDLTQGVSVEVGETQVAVDITIVAEYPMPLQKVADDVRASVYRAIQNLVGMDVTEVNVTINDVHIPSDDTTVVEDDSRARVQ